MHIVIGILLVLVLLVVLLILLLLFVPIRVVARSNDHHYAWHWGKILSGKVIPNRENPQKSKLQLKFLFWSTDLYPFKKKSRKGKEKKEKKKKKQRKKKGESKRSFLNLDRLKSKFLPVLNTFKVDAFRVNIDTDDYVLNGILYPVFMALSNDKRTLEINFNGVVDLEVNIQNKGWRVLYAFFR